MSISGPAKARDIRIDLARGVCLWFILVDHTAANVLNQLTLRNFAICDAADVFVFLCGVSASLAYGTKLDHAGWWEASKAVLRRVRAIYIAQLVLIIMVAALLIASRALGQLEVARFFWLHEQAFSATALIRLACLVDRSSLLGLGILPLYIALLSWFALIIPLVDGRYAYSPSPAGCGQWFTCAQALGRLRHSTRSHGSSLSRSASCAAAMPTCYVGPNFGSSILLQSGCSRPTPGRS